MKFILVFATLIFGLGLMSFTASPNAGVTRIGNQLYLVDETVRFTDSQRALILSTIADEYNLGDWTKVSEDFYSDSPSAKANWILKKKAFVKAIKEKFIKYEDKVVGDNLDALDAILVRYAD